MTKLYCPKGHEINNFPNNNTFFNAAMCHFCKRPYFEIDCIIEPKKENQENPRTLNLNEINNIEIKISANSPSPKTESHVDDINAVETKKGKIIDLKDFVPPLKPASLSFDPLEEQWVNPKRESQVAIERVIEALERVFNYQDVCILDNQLLLQAIIGEMEK